jgi:hypothetical protein
MVVAVMRIADVCVRVGKPIMPVGVGVRPRRVCAGTMHMLVVLVMNV